MHIESLNKYLACVNEEIIEHKAEDSSCSVLINFYFIVSLKEADAHLLQRWFIQLHFASAIKCIQGSKRI